MKLLTARKFQYKLHTNYLLPFDKVCSHVFGGQKCDGKLHVWMDEHELRGFSASTFTIPLLAFTLNSFTCDGLVGGGGGITTKISPWFRLTLVNFYFYYFQEQLIIKRF